MEHALDLRPSQPVLRRAVTAPGGFAPVLPAPAAIATSESAPAGSLRPFDDVVQRLLPVRTARELAVGLAQEWRISTGAASALVIVALIDLGRIITCRSRSEGLPEIRDGEFDPLKTPVEFGAIVSDDAAIGDHGSSREAFAFSTTAGALAGVLLESSDAVADLSSGVSERLRAASGLLVDQAILVERALVARGPAEVARPKHGAANGEKLAAIAEFAAAAGHEINNPLATIAGRVQILLQSETAADRRQTLATIGAQALRIRDMIGDLMIFARPPVPAPRPAELHELTQSVIERFQEAARSRSCLLTLSRDAPETAVRGTVDPAQYSIVVSELVRNSLDAIDSRGEIRLRLERCQIEGKGHAVVSVTDNGRGLSEKDRSHLFDPYYAGRDAGRGLGFGLCKCWRIVANHGGWIEADSVPRVATTFRVFWPDAFSSG